MKRKIAGYTLFIAMLLAIIFGIPLAVGMPLWEPFALLGALLLIGAVCWLSLRLIESGDKK
jgi:hypothetical protein